MINRVVEIFLNLVRIDSPSSEESKVAEYIVNLLQKLGIEANLDKYGNVIGKVEGQGEPIILSGHMDTVEPGRNIQPQIVDGVIKSNSRTILGADNKAWVAAMLAGVESLIQTLPAGRQESNNPIRNLDLVFTREEEVHNGGSAHLDLRLLRGRKGFSCDDDSPLGAIFVASPFYIKIDIVIEGKSAHAAEPNKATNALKATSEAIHLLPLGDIGHKTIRNIGIIRSGNGRNTIPGEVEVVAEIRAFSQSHAAGATAEMVRIFRETALKHNCNLKKTIELENPGFEVKKTDPMVIEAKRALESLGITPRLLETYGCFDANYFAGRGVQIINMSDGCEDGHTTRESVSIENLVMLQKLAEKLMTIN